MSLTKILILTLVVAYKGSKAVESGNPMTLPPLFHLQNYDECLQEMPPAKYCMLYAEIQPNSESSLWQHIAQISEDTRHRYRHDRLFFGVCLSQCLQALNSSSEAMNAVAKINELDQETVDYFGLVYRESAVERQQYQQVLDTCLNKDFQEQYNLSLNTFIEYCNEANGNTPSDSIAPYALILLLLTLVLCSTVYDWRLSRDRAEMQEENGFFRKDLQSIKSSILTSFSVCRNYYRITDNQNPANNDLEFTYAFRFFTMFIVILGHTLTILTAMPILNVSFIEQHLNGADSMIYQNGSAIIQIFFVLSGFFLKLNFDKQKAVTPDTSIIKCILVYNLFFFSRYLRIAPSFAMLLFFNAFFLLPLGNGPLWRHVAQGESVLCSKYWWQNLLLVNNYTMQRGCAHHTWYLAADMQLFELYLIILIVTAKFPSTKTCLYILLASFSVVVPGFITYLFTLEAASFLRPETYRYFYFKDADTFYQTYPPFYCNLGGYLIGLLCAQFYAKFIQAPDKSIGAKFRTNIKVQAALLVFIFVCAFALLFSGLLVSEASSEEFSALFAIYAAFYRNLWACLGGFTLVCMLLKFGWFSYDFITQPIFRTLGRLTFQMYIWHTTVLRILFGFYRSPIYLSEFFVCCQIALAMLLTVLVAFAMALCVEFPIGHLVNSALKIFKSKLGKPQEQQTI